MTDDPKSSPFRILYVVTTFYSGERRRDMVMPTIRATAESVFLSGLEMDVVVIVGNEEGARRRPPNGFSARQFGRAPGYDGKKKEEVSCIKRALARQHRFVVADRKDEYNLFACWEDDMRFDAGTLHPNTLASRAS